MYIQKYCSLWKLLTHGEWWSQGDKGKQLHIYMRIIYIYMRIIQLQYTRETSILSPMCTLVPT